ncbi:hypothetical protein MTO96_022347 [Rhipicephalus appendiculatus]
MAGMAWTLHPALLYEKYGTVLVQLWDSGAMGTLFRSVRRLSRSIGDAITACRHGSGGTRPPVTRPPVTRPPVVQDQEEALALPVTDESMTTSDEAQYRAYCIPGDTTSTASSSEENELAFQGDVYTQMRRSRRQGERMKKIREARQQFLESSSTCSGSARRRRKRRRGSKFGPSKMRDILRRDGTGTPLTEMEGPVAEPRVVIMDVPDTSSPASPCSELNENAGTGSTDIGMGCSKGLDATRILGDNDSLLKFRAIHGRKASVSPPTRRHSGVQPEPTVERPRDDLPSNTIIPDNDSLNKFRTTHSERKSACTSASEASGQPESTIDLHRGRAHSITPSEQLADNDSLRKFKVAHAGEAASPAPPAGVEVYADECRGVTATEDKSQETAEHKTKRSAFRKAAAEDSSKDGSVLSKQISPTEDHVSNLPPSHEEVSSSSLKGARKKTKAASGDRVQGKKVRRKTKEKSKCSVGEQKSLDHTSSLETTGGEAPSATKSNAISLKGKPKKTTTQLEGEQTKGRRGHKVTGTRSSPKEGAEKDAAMPFTEEYAPIRPAVGTVNALASGTSGVLTGPDLSSTGYTESEVKRRQSVGTPLGTETAKSVALLEEGPTIRTMEDIATSELAVPPGIEVHESENLRPATSTDERAGKHHRSAKWGERVIKRHRKQSKRQTPVSSSSEMSQALTSPRPSVPDGPATDGFPLTPSSLTEVASSSEGSPSRRSRRHSTRRRSKGHGSKGGEGRHGKASKRSRQKADTHDAGSTSRGAGVNIVSSERMEEASRSGAALTSPSTVPAFGVKSQSVTRDATRSVPMESGQSAASSSSFVPVTSATTLTPGTADFGSHEP